MKVRIKRKAIEIDLTNEKSILLRLNDLEVTDLGLSWYFSKAIKFISIDFIFFGITFVLR